MDEATIALVIMSLLILVIFLGFLIWGIKSKQFKNIEEAKYQIFNKTGNQDNSQRETLSPGEEDRKC